MTEVQIKQLLTSGAFADYSESLELVETHISWVILTAEFAYKIKKPLDFSFLDFSTLEKRYHYCLRELKLNQRLAPSIYLAVVPIRVNAGGIPELDGPEGQVIDYAVKMKRLDRRYQMDVLLTKEQVTKSQMQQLADQLAHFHAHADRVDTPFDMDQMQSDFADIRQLNPLIAASFGQKAVEVINEAINFSAHFLQQHMSRFQERQQKGFIVDGHGDLHTENIFLLDEPVIFDCIEFSDELRQVDVLNELAFLCMDLEANNRIDLANYFLMAYLKRYPAIFDEVDQLIFQYYKLYRTNVRLKVNLYKGMQSANSKQSQEHMDLAIQYFMLLKKYLSSFTKINQRSSSASF